MLKKDNLDKAGKLLRLCACTVCFTAMVPFGFSAAGNAVPVPMRKPISQASYQTPFEGMHGVKIERIQYSLKDFTKALLNFGRAPVPDGKPYAVDTSTSMSAEEANLYRDVFAMQGKGDMKSADKILARLSDHRLRGYVLHQRYMHPTAYVSSFRELQEWLARYNDLPGADDIYELAQSKRPQGNTDELAKPEGGIQIPRMADPYISYGKRYKSSVSRDKAQRTTVKAKQKEILRLIRQRKFTQAQETLNTKEMRKTLDSIERDELAAELAERLLYIGDINVAHDIAVAATRQSGMYVPKAAWVAGLTSWMNKDYVGAANAFEIVGQSIYGSSWLRSAGAYWAGRSYRKLGDEAQTREWMRKASVQPHTFYGLMARKALGRRMTFNWDVPNYTNADAEILQEHEPVRRAMALLAAGQSHLAEAELLRLDISDEKTGRALIALAMEKGLSGLAYRLGHKIRRPNGGYYDAALYPASHWAETVLSSKNNKALVHAVMRQESRFETLARSSKGAKGLMQLMPKTAQFVASLHNIKDYSRNRLSDPYFNVDLGARHIDDLLKNPMIAQDMMSMLIAYNAGPGNLKRWRERWPEASDDPLLFIELLPARETRDYVEKVLANYWIYRMRFGQDVPTLVALYNDQPAIYRVASLTHPVDDGNASFQVASSR